MSLVTLSQQDYGMHNNAPVFQFKLSNSQGMQVTLLSYGGIVQGIQFPDPQGNMHNLVVGLSSLQEYLDDKCYLGALVGRYANRIANAEYQLDNTRVALEKNAPPHSLHGGSQGLHNQVFKASTYQTADEARVVLSTVLKNGTGGFPGDLFVSAAYTLNNDNVLSLELRATTNAVTPVNLTSHPYFSMGFSDNIKRTELTINAQRYTATCDDLIPTGETPQVNGTPYDFCKACVINTNIAAKRDAADSGFDVNYVVNTDCEDLSVPIATAVNTELDIAMDVYSNMPGLQFYTGDCIDFGGLCLEPQHFPDAVNQPSFPTAWLHPEQTYRHTIKWAFRHAESE